MELTVACRNRQRPDLAEDERNNMVVTKDFVFIHMNKTGGTFVTELLRKVYLGYRYRPGEIITLKAKCLHLRDRVLRNLSFPLWFATIKHEYCSKLPSKYNPLQFLSVF